MDQYHYGRTTSAKVRFTVKVFRYFSSFHFSLGVEPVDHDVLKKPPRKVTDPMINRSLIINMVTSATVIVIGTLCVFYAEVCLS